MHTDWMVPDDQKQPPGALNRGLAWLDATRWSGGVLGFAGAGYAVQLLGLRSALWMGTMLPMLAIGLLAVAGSHFA